MSAAELLEQIVELRETIGSNPHPDDFVGEREDLAALEAQYRAVTTESQRKAVDCEGGGMFTPHIDGDQVSFTTPKGDRLPFTIWAGWSSTSVGLPLVTVDTEGDLESPAEPVLRISLTMSRSTSRRLRASRLRPLRGRIAATSPGARPRTPRVSSTASAAPPAARTGRPARCHRPPEGRGRAGIPSGPRRAPALAAPLVPPFRTVYSYKRQIYY